MPRSVEFGGIYSSTAFAERAEAAVQIASIATAWSAIEAQLVLMFSGTLGKKGKQGVQVGTPAEFFSFELFPIHHNEVAGVILGAIHTFSARLSVVDKVFTRELSEQHLRRWKNLIKRLKAAGEDRNFVVHSAWQVLDEEADAGLRASLIARRNNAWEAWSAEDFAAIATRIEMLRVEVALFASAVHLQP